MAAPFHAGELAVQARAGVADVAARVGAGIARALPPGLEPFLRARRFVTVGARDRDGAVWATALHGPPGFVDAVEPWMLRIGAVPPADDPLHEAIAGGAPVGVLALDPETRRRARINGVAVARSDAALHVDTRQVYLNCPKYIARRTLLGVRDAAAGGPARVGDALSPVQAARIAAADTCFVASVHPEAGADCSHRGGPPGFVAVLDARTLRWPDYPGNAMFQTLGNLSIDERIGVTFVDFAAGDVLQLTGRARIVWEAPDARAVEVVVERLVDRAAALPLVWRLEELSPHNPPP